MVHERSIYTTFSHLHTSHITCSFIPRSSPPPTVACKTTGEERLGKMLCTISNVCQSNITWVCANLGFIAHCVITVKWYIATAAGNKVSKHLEVA